MRRSAMDEQVADPSEEALLAELQEMAVESAPRRFALCVLDVGQDDGAVLGWGLALPDEAIAYLYREAGPCVSILRAPTAARFPRMLRRAGDVKLLWIDAAPPEL